METRALSVLVIDDLSVNQESARQTIASERYGLTVAASVEDAMALLGGGCWEDDDRRGGYGGFGSFPERRVAFDVVLTDLMLPTSPWSLADKNVAGRKEAYGFPIALYALTIGVKYVAIVSDLNHHAHPMAAIADAFYGKTPMLTNGSQKFLSMCPVTHVQTVSCNKCGGSKKWFNDTPSVSKIVPCFWCDETGFSEGKDWGAVLAILLQS